MKRNILRATVILLSAIIGWMLGYLRLPQTERSHTFIIGFGACLVLILFIAVFRTMWLKKVVKKGQDISVKSDNDQPVDRTGLVMGTILIIAILLGLVSAAYLFQRQSTINQELNDTRTAESKKLAQSSEAIRISQQVTLMGRVLEQVESEVKNNSRDTISDATIAKIAALCYSFKPYRIVEGDSFSNEELSPERGYLLLALSRIKIDTSALVKLYSSVSFEKADLRYADLSNAQLPHINLNKANLSGSNFSKANMPFANLSKTKCFGTNFNEADLNHCYFRKAYCGWAEFNGAILLGSNINGSNFENAQLRDADLKETMIQWAFFNGAVCVNADFTKSDLTRTDMNRANLTNADFTKARFFKVALNNATVKSVRLDSAEVHQEWLEWIRDSKVVGSISILKNVEIETDSSDPKRYPKYYLKVREK